MLTAKASQRIPLVIWLAVGVFSGHALFFWLVWDKHFLPHVPPPPPGPPPVNFRVRDRQVVDLQTGQTMQERGFTISTHLVTPAMVEGTPKSP